MRTVEVAVVGGETYEVSLADLGTDPTYGDLLSVTEFGPHEVSVLVEGTPVPEDEPVSADRVEVLRLVAGGSGLPSVTSHARPSQLNTGLRSGSRVFLYLERLRGAEWTSAPPTSRTCQR